MNRKERTVQFFDLSVSARSKTFDAPTPITLLRFFELLAMVPIQDARKAFSSGTFEVYISALTVDAANGLITILMNKCDKAVADPTFTVPAERKRRVANKTSKEGQDYSAHVLIKIDLNDPTSAGLFLLEHCPGLSGTLVTKVLGSLVNEARSSSPKDFVQMHPDGSIGSDGKPRTYNVKFSLVHVGHPSDELVEDLNEGKLQSIELITETVKNSGFDEVGFMKEKCETIVLKPKPVDGAGLTNWDKLLKVFSKGKVKYSTARVRFVNKAGTANVVNLETETAASELYVKKVKIDGFAALLNSSYDNFNPEIITKMRALA